MKIIFFASFCLLLGISSCFIETNSQPYEMTARVVDVDSKPIPNREVRVFVRTQPFAGFLFSDEQTHALGITDAEGQVVLRYSLDINEGLQQFATVFASEDDVMRTVNVITHPSNSTKRDVIKQSGTIVMDSLVPFTMRFKTERVDVTGFSTFVSSGQAFSSSQSQTNISRTFLNGFGQTRTPKLDTLITTKVYSKAEFWLNSALFLSGSPYSITKNNVRFSKNQDRSGVFLQTF